MKKHSVGFTFIELLIVVMIISVISGLSLAYFNSFNKASKLDTEANKLIQTLELAKKKATSRDVQGFEDDCANLDNTNPNNTFDGYQVVLSATGYTLQIKCTGAETDIYTYSYPKNSSGAQLIEASWTTATILFKPTPSETSLSANQEIQIKYKTVTNTKCPIIDVSSTGIIQKSASIPCT